MTNVKFQKKEFESALGSKITKEIEEKISLFGTPLEKINDQEIEVEIFPNRPDLISLQGYMRSFRAFLDKSPRMTKYNIKKPEKNYEVKISQNVKDVRPHTACAIIKGLNFNDEKIKEIINLQEKLHLTIGRNRKKAAIGIYPLEKITLPIKYEARDPEKIKFTPLESEKEMTALQILRKHPAGKEYEHLLINHDKFPVFVDAKNNILSMPPIINSNETGKITSATKEVFIECSGEHLPTLKKTLNIIVTTLAELGGKIWQMTLQYADQKIVTPDLTPDKMNLSLEKTNKLLGLELKESDLHYLLAKMGFDYKNKTVYIPSWRVDILHEVDLIEDIAIAYGYNSITPEMPEISTVAEENAKERFKTKIRELMIGARLTEISTYHLIKQREADLCKTVDKIEIENSKTEYKILRPSLLIPALRILAENKDHEYPQEIFEIGAVFSKNSETETGIEQKDNLFIALSPANFTKIKQILDYLSSSLDLDYKLTESAQPMLAEGRTAEIQLKNKTIGYMGEVHPQTLHNWTIKMPLAILEISLDEIFIGSTTK